MLGRLTRENFIESIYHDDNFNERTDVVLEILALYAREKQKQIFIAFDREGKYDVETQSIIKENTVLKLDTDEQALFGWKWSRNDAEK